MKNADEFGRVRPIVHCDFKGQKVIAVGSHLMMSKSWNTFIDFLVDYIGGVLGSEWGNSEITKPWEERHPLMKWYDGLCRQQAEAQHKQNGKFFSFVPNASSFNYLHFAYDVYCLAHHSSFQEKILRRIKHIDQFQGARYELFAAATCIRGGYELKYEDESRSGSKHQEFHAKHLDTGRVISVEAKSKHRPGVLGYSGASDLNAVKIKVRSLINQALEKPAIGNRVIFVELNIFQDNSNFLESKWFKEIADSACGLELSNGDDPFEMIVFTNNAAHTNPSEEITSGVHSLVMFRKGYTFQNPPPNDLIAIKRAVDIANKIPSKLSF